MLQASSEELGVDAWGLISMGGGRDLLLPSPARAGDSGPGSRLCRGSEPGRPYDASFELHLRVCHLGAGSGSGR